MPRKRKAVKFELKGVEKKVRAFIDFLNKVGEETWQEDTANLISDLGFPKERATDRSQWFSKPAAYNSDDSPHVKAETILNFSNLFKEPMRRIAEGDATAALAPMFFIVSKIIPHQPLSLDTIKQVDLGILDEIAMEFALLLPILHSQNKIGICKLEGCEKLFLKDRRTQEYCSENHRKLDWKRQHAKPS